MLQCVFRCAPQFQKFKIQAAVPEPVVEAPPPASVAVGAAPAAAATAAAPAAGAQPTARTSPAAAVTAPAAPVNAVTSPDTCAALRVAAVAQSSMFVGFSRDCAGRRYLPKSHTCFFSLNLPAYSSDEVWAVCRQLYRVPTFHLFVVPCCDLVPVAQVFLFLYFFSCAS